MAKAKKKPSLKAIPVAEEKTLFAWEAPERPYQEKNKEFWTTILSILGLICLILFFAKEWFLITTLAALVFLYYVLTTVPPQKSKYRITTKGIYVAPSQKIEWEIMRRFWLDEKWGYVVLHLETWLKFPRTISFVILKKDLEEITAILKKYLPQEKSSPNFLDKFSSWLAKKVPLETK